ncbi:MAG TPA: GPP34 family phosphoprotein [Thermoanaerobaculia bacterium]|nr:GPP34 family phosphoprotein [Thermoanaerobaculia bacterium]
MTSHPHLRLHEQMLLLALRDERGTADRKAGMWRLAFGGGLLAELALEDRIEIEPGKKAIVRVRDRAPLGDPVLDAALARIADAPRPLGAARWVGKLPTLALWRESAAGLCRRGVLQRTEGRVLFLFTRTRFPTVDSGPERALHEAIRATVDHDDSPVDQRLASLIGIAHAAGTLWVLYGRKELKARKARLEEIARADRAADATRAAVAAVQAAVIAAVTASAAASAAAG